MVRLEAGYAADLAEGSMKEVPLDSSDQKSPKVLVSKVNGKVYATSSKCTHYHAPLAKGILNAKTCTVRCPWHGAKFNLCTGDIEDAPGIGSLLTFNVIEQEGKLFVEADESDIKAFSKPVKPCATTQHQESIVVIGGGNGGYCFVDEIRRAGWRGKVTLIMKENYLPIDRTKLSKALSTDPDKISLRDNAFYQSLDVTILKGTTVESLDLKARHVKLSDSKIISYSYLVYAAGSTPNTVSMEGSDLEGILTLRDLENSKNIDAVLGTEDNKNDIVVIGSSFIGMELGVCASKRARVKIIGRSKTPFQAVLGEQVGNAIRKLHEKNGVQFYMDAQVEKFIPSKEDPQKVGGVKLKSGEILEGSAVIVSVGVRPQTSLLEKAGISLEKDGSVRVDETLKIVDSRGEGRVFAVGDVATFPDALSGGHLCRIEHWNVAGNHARTVARTLGSGSPCTYSNPAVFWSSQGSQIRYVGIGKASLWQHVHIVGDLDEMKFVAYYAIEDEVVAVASSGKDPIVAKCTELFSETKMPSLSQIKSGVDPLEIKIM